MASPALKLYASCNFDGQAFAAGDDDDLDTNWSNQDVHWNIRDCLYKIEPVVYHVDEPND